MAIMMPLMKTANPNSPAIPLGAKICINANATALRDVVGTHVKQAG